MANEKSGKQQREERNNYERSRVRIRKGGSTESAAAAMAGGRVPSSGAPTPQEITRMVSKLDQGLPNDFGVGWEALNNRHMALGQRLQELAFGCINSEEWQANFMANATPNDVLKWAEIGAKMERQAHLGQLEIENKKKSDKEGAGHNSGLVHKALKSSALVDAIHELIDEDDFMDEDEEE